MKAEISYCTTTDNPQATLSQFLEDHPISVEELKSLLEKPFGAPTIIHPLNLYGVNTFILQLRYPTYGEYGKISIFVIQKLLYLLLGPITASHTYYYMQRLVK
jgi:hypothetical protein